MYLSYNSHIILYCDVFFLKNFEDKIFIRQNIITYCETFFVVEYFGKLTGKCEETGFICEKIQGRPDHSVSK